MSKIEAYYHAIISVPLFFLSYFFTFFLSSSDTFFMLLAQYVVV